MLAPSLLLLWKEGQVQPGKVEVEAAEEDLHRKEKPELVCDFC